MSKSHVTINGQKITWAMVMKVRSMFKGDWDDTMDAFWKARNARGPDSIIRYIMKGFLPGKNGVRYIMMPSAERENGQMNAIREWWNSLYERHPRTPVMSVKDVFKAIAAGVED